MTTKSITSTQAQNNFGRVMDDITHNHTRYIIERRKSPQAILLSLDDFAHLLDSKNDRQQMDKILREIRPDYQLGRIVEPTDKQ